MRKIRIADDADVDWTEEGYIFLGSRRNAGIGGIKASIIQISGADHATP